MDALSKRNDFAEKFGPASIKKQGNEEQQQKKNDKKILECRMLNDKNRVFSSILWRKPIAIKQSALHSKNLSFALIAHLKWPDQEERLDFLRWKCWWHLNHP